MSWVEAVWKITFKWGYFGSFVGIFTIIWLHLYAVNQGFGTSEAKGAQVGYQYPKYNFSFVFVRFKSLILIFDLGWGSVEKYLQMRVFWKFWRYFYHHLTTPNGKKVPVMIFLSTRNTLNIFVKYQKSSKSKKKFLSYQPKSRNPWQITVTY